MNKMELMLALLLGIYSMNMAYASSGGFGEGSGYLYFNLQPNSTQSLTWTLINEYNTSIYFNITPGMIMYELGGQSNTFNLGNLTLYKTQTLNWRIYNNNPFAINFTVEHAFLYKQAYDNFSANVIYSNLNGTILAHSSDNLTIQLTPFLKANNSNDSYLFQPQASFSPAYNVPDPIITFNPDNGIIPAGDGSYVINVTAYIPKNVPINFTWHILPTAKAYEFANNSVVRNQGVSISIGTAKNMFISSFTTTTVYTITTTINSIPITEQTGSSNSIKNNGPESYQLPLLVMGIIGISILSIGGYMLTKNKKSKSRIKKSPKVKR